MGLVKSLTLHLLALALLLAALTGCAGSPSIPAAELANPTQAAPAQPAPGETQPVLETQPAGATPKPLKATAVPGTPAPYVTPTLQKLSRTCLNPGDYEPMVNRYLSDHGKKDLKELWEEFDKNTPVYGLMASLTDVTNEYAHATTYSKMMLVGEYKISINRPDAVGYAHCAVLVYMGGDEPEVGTGITDAVLNDNWTGFAYGTVRSEPEMREYIKARIGDPVLVRYHVSQDPRDVNFVRTGFFSPTMRLLWEHSYYTRFSQNPDMLKDSVQSPRGPSLKSMMKLLTSWPDEDIGVFIDYIIDPIL